MPEREHVTGFPAVDHDDQSLTADLLGRKEGSREKQNKKLVGGFLTAVQSVFRFDVWRCLAEKTFTRPEIQKSGIRPTSETKNEASFCS